MNKEYQFMAPNLPGLPAVFRQEIRNIGTLPIIEKLSPLVELDWRSSQYRGSHENSWEVTKGNFNDGETIQVTAPANSLYGAHGLVPLADIEPASSERNCLMLREWLSTCMASHESCRSSQSMTDDPAEDTTLLPTRVIDLGAPEEPGSQPRLFLSKKTSGQYIALSHRWSKTIAVKLKRENLFQYEKELPVDGMPPTFRDAIEVTR
ncbi:tol protein [Ilyonectria robusta]